MAGKKKTKKPAANPARGFATTSLPSRQTRVAVEEATETASATTSHPAANNLPTGEEPSSTSGDGNATASSSAKRPETELTPEEFERELEESQLQLLVEKHGAKVRRDAQRQKTRLETDRRLLRASAETLNAKRWLPKELMDHMLELIKAESRFATTGVGSELYGSNAVAAKGAGQLPSEEDLILRLWTLQQTLGSMDFPQDKIKPVLIFTLRIAPSISTPSSGKSETSVWGLEEALDWFARECELDELPDYNGRKQRSQTGGDTPVPSGATTPRFLDLGETRPLGKKQKNPSRSATPRKLPNVSLGDIEPDQLLPFYLEYKEKLFAIQRSRPDTPKDSRNSNKISYSNNNDFSRDEDADELLLLAKLDLVEKDVLFDKLTASQKWRERKIALEKEYATNKKRQAEAEKEKPTASAEEAPAHVASNNPAADVSEEAERIAVDMLAKQEDEDDDELLTGLFDSLPVAEVDPTTGKTSTALNGADGLKIFIRDFGKFTGMSPVRILEEACRSRDSSVKISYHGLSDISYASRHAVRLAWSKPQELPSEPEVDGLESFAIPTQFAYKMDTIAAPDARQSEAYVATVALFAVFGSSAKDEKVAMRLPASYKDLWSELADRKKSKADEQDRELVRHLRDLVRKRMEREEEDGVILSGAFKGRQAKNPTESDQSDQERTQRRHVFSADYYQRIWLQKCSTPRFQQMLGSRMQLPIWQFRNQIIEAVEQNQVVIVCGETGCGKSTQVPSFLLEHQLVLGKPCKMYCTEPRRISAISLARRVSEELGEGRNDLGTPRSLVGYSIRLEANTSRETRIVYATTGIVMRMLEGSSDLSDMTHLVLDEVHERSIDSDFLLIILKRLLRRRKDLKVVLMSATVDADRFSQYMGGAPVLNVPGRTFPVRVAYLEDAVQLTDYTLDQRGVTNDKVVDLDDDQEPETDSSSKQELVKFLKAGNYSNRTQKTLAQMDEYKIDHDLIVQLIRRIANDPQYVPYSKAILIFLPGIAEIRTLNDLLLGDRAFADSWLVYPLHSTIASEDQEAAFLVPPPGIRKIVLATNIAETGITIPDITCVFDTGKHREMRFDERRQLSRLIDTFISRANAKQRCGRAGRVQEGLCFHLFTKYRHDNIMSDQQTPEILRLSLQDLAIRVKMCRLGGIEATLREALDPPSTKNIRRAVDALVDARALTVSNAGEVVGSSVRHNAAAGAAATPGASGGGPDNIASLNTKEELTPLGVQLARLPLDVFLGKLILLGTIFRCLDMAVTAAALLSGGKSPFQAPFGQRTQADAARRSFRRGDSDILTIYNAYCAWRRVCQTAVGGGGGGAEFQFCRKNYLNPQALANVEELKGQLLSALADSGALQLTSDERQTLSRTRFGGGGGGRRRGGGHSRFVEVPKRVDTHSDNDVVAQAVIAWSFYPKLLIRDGVSGAKGGWRNVASNQAISLHPSSVNKGRQMGSEQKWVSYYHIMQSKSVYHAHETTAVDAFAIALLCGDVRADLYAGVLVLDGNRARFACPDWKSALVIKALRARLRDAMARFLKWPAKQPTAQHERWIEAWQRVFATAWEARQKAMAAAGGV